MGTWEEAYLTRLRGCAVRLQREFADISDRDRAVRLVEGDARLVEQGFADGMLRMESAGRVRTLDPLQANTWLVEGVPARPRWETLSHLAGYVELLRAGYPESVVRFATSESELELDLAAVDDDGHVLLLGVARAEPLELARLEALVPTFEDENAGSAVRTVPGHDARQLACQLWATRAPYLWLVAAGTRRLHRVLYGRTIRLTPVAVLPEPEDLWPFGVLGRTPRIALVEAVAG